MPSFGPIIPIPAAIIDGISDQITPSVKAFVNAVLDKIEEFNSGTTIIHTEATKKLTNKYSPQVELDDMRLVSKNIAELIDFAR